MKRLTSTIASLFLIVVVLSSCGEIKEEITLNSDGSGSYRMSADMIPMMRTMMYSFAKMSADEGADSLEIMAEVEEKLWKDFPDEIDSVLNIANRLDEEIKNNPDKMALLESTTMFMRGGKSKGYMHTGLEFDFANSEEFNQLMDLVQEGQQKDKQANMLGKSETEIKVTPKLFYRKTTQVSELDSDKLPPNMSGMMDEMKVLTVLKFERKIKSIDVKGYGIVEKSNNQVTLEYDLSQRLNKGDFTEIKVQLK